MDKLEDSLRRGPHFSNRTLRKGVSFKAFWTDWCRKLTAGSISYQTVCHCDPQNSQIHDPEDDATNERCQSLRKMISV